MQYYRCGLTSARGYRGTVISPDPLTVLLVHIAQALLFLLCCQGTPMAPVHLVPTKTSWAFSTGQLPSQAVPSLYCCEGFCLPRCKALHLPLLNFMRFLSAHSSNLSRSFWVAALPSCILTAPSGLVSSVNLMWVYSDSSSRLLMKMLNNISPSINP